MKNKLIPHFQNNIKLIKTSHISIFFISFLVIRNYYKFNYPWFFWSIDLPTTFLFLTYVLALRPLIYSGKLTAYYPVRYDKDIMKFTYYYCMFAVSAMGRALAVITNERIIMTGNINYLLFTLSAAIPIYLFLYLYYKNRFVSIKRYSEGTKLIMFSNAEKYKKCRLDSYQSGITFILEYGKYNETERLKKERREIKSKDPVLNEMFKAEIIEIEKDEVPDDANQPLRRKNRAID